MDGAPMDRDEPFVPHNIVAEQQVLGVLLSTNEGAFTHVSDILEMEHFFDPVHRDIYNSIVRKEGEGINASPITLKPEFDGYPNIGNVTVPQYMIRMVGTAFNSAFRDCAVMLRDLHAKRLMLEKFQDGASRIKDGIEPISSIALDVEDTAGRLASVSSPRRLLHSFQSASVSAIKAADKAYNGEGVPGVLTGIMDLDRVIGSLRPQESTVLAGRPAMGKTTLAHNIALNAALAGYGVFFASLEMSADQLATRAFSYLLARTGKQIAYNDILNGRLNATQYRDVLMAANDGQHLPLQTGEKECRDINKFRSAARRAKQTMADTPNPLGLIVVDYVQKLSDPRARNDYSNAGAVSDAVKNLSMDMEVPVLALSQLNRRVEDRQPPIPMLSDLRDSGKLEEDADNVMFAYRPAYYLEKEIAAARGKDANLVNGLEADLASVRNTLNVIVGKQRNGPTATATAKIHIKNNYVGTLADNSQEAMQI